MTPRNLWQFARDYVSEFGIAWSLARHRHCERTGGHRWAELNDGWRQCERCGTSEMRAHPYPPGTVTASTNAAMYWVAR